MRTTVEIPDELFRRASVALRVGNLAEAEHLYRSVLRAQPHHLGALNLLGILLIQLGRDDEAERSIRTALGRATGEIAVIQDSDLEYDPNDLPHLLTKIVRSGPIPIAVPAVEIAGADTGARVGCNRRLRRLARMTGRAIVGEDEFALPHGIRRVEAVGASGSVLQLVWIGCLQQEQSQIGGLQLSRIPIGRVRPRRSDLYRPVQ